MINIYNEANDKLLEQCEESTDIKDILLKWEERGIKIYTDNKNKNLIILLILSSRPNVKPNQLKSYRYYR